MPDNEKSENSSLANILILIFTIVSLIAGGSLIFKNWIGFNLDNFGDAKEYFLSSDQKLTASSTDALNYQKFAEVDLLNEAADSLVDIDSNHVAQVRQMSICYAKMYDTMPKLYDEINAYDNQIATMTVIVIVLWVASLWGVRQSFINRANQENSSSKVSAEIVTLKDELGKIKKQVNKIPKKPR